MADRTREDRGDPKAPPKNTCRRTEGHPIAERRALVSSWIVPLRELRVAYLQAEHQSSRSQIGERDKTQAGRHSMGTHVQESDELRAKEAAHLPHRIDQAKRGGGGRLT